MEGASIQKREGREAPAPAQAGKPVDAPGEVRVERDHHPLWLWPNLLSLDAPVVAVAWQMLFAKTIGVAMPVAVHVLLGMAVWVIYVSDRLIDAARLDVTRPATARHLFCRRHWRVFLASVIVVAGLGALGALKFVPEALAARGFFLILFVGGYFGFVALMRRTRTIVIPKEILCGCLFAIGTNLGPAFYSSNYDAGGPGWKFGFVMEGMVGIAEAALPLTVFLFMALCCLNCAIIAKWEKGVDREQDAAALSHVRRALDVPFSWSLLFLAAIATAMMVREWGGGEAAAHICVAAGAIGLWLLEWKAHLFSRAGLRTMADAVLLTPLVALPMM